MPRRYRRRRYAVSRPVKTTKYSNETYNFSTTLSSSTAGVHGVANVPIMPVLQNVSFLGTRKAKNFTIKFGISPSTITSAAHPDQTLSLVSQVYWALVYVPEGTVPSALAIGSAAAPASLYDPNQNVIMSGVLSSTQAVSVAKSRLARNLNSNDQLYLCLYDGGAPNAASDWGSVSTQVYAQINFAIAF